MARSKKPKETPSNDGTIPAPRGARKSKRVNPLARNPLLLHGPSPEELKAGSRPPAEASPPSEKDTEKENPNTALPQDHRARKDVQEENGEAPSPSRPGPDETIAEPDPVQETNIDQDPSEDDLTVAALKEEIEKLRHKIESSQQNGDSSEAPHSEEPWRKMFGSGRVTSVTMARETLDTLKYLQHQFEAGAGHGFTAKQRDIINFSVLLLGHLLKEIGPFEFARRFQGIASSQADEFYGSLWQECQTRINPK